MTIAAEARPVPQLSQSWLVRLFDYKPFLIFICLLPAMGLLLVFLSYPLGLGIWLAFTDTRIGRGGYFIGFENFESLWQIRSSSPRSGTRCSIPGSRPSGSSRSASGSRCCSTTTCRSSRCCGR